MTSALLREDASDPGSESGSLLGVNTVGAILGSLLVPFVLMPTIGSPAVIAVLAVINVVVGIGLAWISTPRATPTIAIGAVALLAVVLLVRIPGLITQPTAYVIPKAGGELYASTEDEIASVQAGKVSSTPQLWVTGTSMTLLTVDAKLMPILPLIARPASTRALVVAFGMGTAFRSSLIAGLKTDVVELVPSVPKMFGYYYPDAANVLANPNGKVIIADGRNHLELTTDRFDIIVTDPPPPIESSGVSVISSLEYYQAGRDHLTPGGIMMQWTPFGAPINELKDHMRTFRAVFPYVLALKGPGGYGFYMLGSDEPISLHPDAVRSVLDRPGVLADLSSAFDSPASTVEGWSAVLALEQWMIGPEIDAFAGVGQPLITDDHPRPEYFLLRRLFGINASPQ
jgi:spermidine synthase